MSTFKVHTNVCKLPSGKKLVGLSVSLPDNDLSYTMLLEPENAEKVAKLLFSSAAEAQRVIDTPNPPASSVVIPN